MSEDQLIHKIRGKSKNSLSLNEKVAVINRYVRYPVYSRVARAFHCSADQIKRIIKHKDEILKEWENLESNLAKQKYETKEPETAVPCASAVQPAQYSNNTVPCASTVQPVQCSNSTVPCERTSVKMVILCKAVYGRIHRQMSESKFHLTDSHIENVATEFKNILSLPNFFPDKAWIKSFREAYNLKEVNTKTLDFGPKAGDVPGACKSSETENGLLKISKKSAPKDKVRFDNRVKPKNVLALNEKVAAIRRYDIDPVYKSVGRYFNCSPDQIKRIIKQRDEILNEWENRTKKRQINLSSEMKTVKISFLGKAVHEWIRRMMYYSDFDLSDTLIRTMAIEFKKALNLPNFFPDKSWIVSFRNTYNLRDVSTKTLNIGHKEGHSVQIRDILRFLQSICGSSETEVSNNDSLDAGTTEGPIQQMVQNSTSIPATSTSKPAKAVKRSGKASTSTAAKKKKKAKRSAKLKYLNNVNSLCTPSSFTAVSNWTSTTTSVVLTEEVPLKIKSEPEEVVPMETETESIMSYDEAINCVRQLEEFALLKENFRLIGLIERLDEALKEKK